jgi:hypothetical protein
MQDESVGEGVGGIGADAAKVRAVDLGHDFDGFVADGLFGAVVLVGSTAGG